MSKIEVTCRRASSSAQQLGAVVLNPPQEHDSSANWIETLDVRCDVALIPGGRQQAGPKPRWVGLAEVVHLRGQGP
ncbi:MAG: hypothetical protein P8M78_04750 [Myxococcota bacterium]|nr:hypothetical protein [Myxococcota bacterium]